MKRKLALFMVLAMLISLVPMNVFAASANSISNVPTVTEDWDFLAEGSAPTLKVGENDAADFATTQTFILKLSNADWADDVTTGDFEDNDALSSGNITVSYELVGDNLEVTVITDSVDEEWVKVPMLATVKDAGVAKVIVDAVDSAVTEGEYTFAKVATGDTKATYDVDDVESFSDTDELSNLKVEELAIGTLEDGDQIKLRLNNSDFSWNTDGANYDVALGGGFASGVTVVLNEAVGGGTDDQTLVFDVDIATQPATRGYVIFEGLIVEADSDAAYGDVKVKVFGDNVTQETLVVAKYSDYSVTVEADDEAADLPEIYSGYLDLDGTETVAEGEVTEVVVGDVDQEADENQLSTLWIKEDVFNTLDDGKRIKVALPDGVSIMAIDLDGDTDGVTDTITALDDNELGNELEFTVTRDGDGDKAEIGIELWVSVEAGFTGDITATVSGKAMNGESMKAVIGNAVAPITATVEAADVRIGVKDQALGKITVTEAAEGVLAKGKNLVFKLSDMGIDGDAVVKVTKGDIEFEDPEIMGDDDYLVLEVKNDSSEASTFEITGLTVTVDRSLPEGDYNLKIGGDAIVMNNDGEGDFFFFDASNLVSVTGARVITPAPGDTQAGEKVVFTIGSADYMIGAVKMTSDVAPYINENGRTMLPLRALANALGVEDRNIIWNDAEHSVVIFKGDATLKIIIGQTFFNKNGVLVPMDTQAVIMNSRTFLPLRAMGEALGAIVTWDEATRTVTIQ